MLSPSATVSGHDSRNFIKPTCGRLQLGGGKAASDWWRAGHVTPGSSLIGPAGAAVQELSLAHNPVEETALSFAGKTFTVGKRK